MRRLVALGAALLLAASLPAHASERAESARRGAEYLVAHQAADGTFFGDAASHRVAETLVAVIAGGIAGEPVTRALSAISAAGPDAARRAGEAGLIVMGIAAAGEDPHDFQGENYVARLQSFYVPALGAYDTQMFQNALALLGVLAAGEPVPDEAITFLRVTRCIDGGFPVQAPCGGAGGHVDVTALLLNALAAAGVPPSDALRADARAFLACAPNDEGGFGDGANRTTNANSTGLALTAIAAAGEDATQAPWRQPDGDDPVRALLALQQTDGRFHSNAMVEGDSALATRQAVPGMAGRALPLGAPAAGGRDPAAVPPSDVTRHLSCA